MEEDSSTGSNREGQEYEVTGVAKLLYQVIIAFVLLCFMLNLVLNLRSLRIPRVASKIAGSMPLVSVLVPARDEEENIETCLASLMRQDYPNFEVLVLDDNSSDATASIVERLAARDNRIQMIPGGRLEEGWAGKPFACHQLAQKAKGDWLLFVDADTIHTPQMLRSVVALALERKPSMLSGFPRQLMTSVPQRVAIPVLYFIILSWLPLWWLQRSGKPKPSLAIGQFLLFPTEEYWRIGGHKAVKSRILEDVWLAVEVARHGGRHLTVDLSPVVSCNMYRSIPAMWEGFIKWMYSVAILSKVALAGLLVAGYIFFLAPFYWLWSGLFMRIIPLEAQVVILLQVFTIYSMRWYVDNRFRTPFISTLLHPFGFLFLIITVIYAGWRQIVGAGVNWKKRLYGSESGVA